MFFLKSSNVYKLAMIQTINRLKMSQVDKQARHVPTCEKPESIIKECPIVLTTDGDSLNVSSQKRKEDATPILYLNRV